MPRVVAIARLTHGVRHFPQMVLLTIWRLVPMRRAISASLTRRSRRFLRMLVGDMVSVILTMYSTRLRHVNQ